MKEPEKFPKVLTGSMIFMTVLFTSVGVVSYLAFGDKVETVILLNLPAHSAIVNSVQLLYAMAICLSIPLQLFPAIRIMENGLFTLSGKTNMKVKWQKNMFRFGMVVVCSIIAIGGSNVSKFIFYKLRPYVDRRNSIHSYFNQFRISISLSLSLVRRVVYPLVSYSLLFSI
jgi:proton-coupled amino acid transporter